MTVSSVHVSGTQTSRERSPRSQQGYAQTQLRIKCYLSESKKGWSALLCENVSHSHFGWDRDDVFINSFANNIIIVCAVPVISHLLVFVNEAS